MCHTIICITYALTQLLSDPSLGGHTIEGLRERTKHLDIFLFPSIIQWCSIFDVLFTGGRGVSDFSVLKYY